LNAELPSRLVIVECVGPEFGDAKALGSGDHERTSVLR
jgi:hypothetical protein